MNKPFPDISELARAGGAVGMRGFSSVVSAQEIAAALFARLGVVAGAQPFSLAPLALPAVRLGFSFPSSKAAAHGPVCCVSCGGVARAFSFFEVFSMKASFSIPVGVAYGSEEVVPNMQAGLDVLDAAYHTVHNYPGGVAALAVRMGMPVTTLTHKVNVNNTTHHLTLREAVSVQHFSGNAAILQAMAEALGYVCVRATPAATGEPMHQLAEMASEFSDTLRAGSDAVALGAGRVTPNAMRRYDHYAAQLQSAVNALAGTLRGMMPVRGEGGK